ncbi:hypothetical protein [Acetobacteroides hydrogenigenes]|jgi:hypothetical protein|uniref:Pre-peptidase n=1 Tax=Acetobacteroides hydrogenigenes TaxID=979970 RepID=A0A4V2RN34_9BACT|nr:hypothetical protein [Acetobacteroides hydrogenigenes]TCN62120.1 hypothetical protein CLV25_12033 [Acetobacteroides hydrogenigenes]
MKKILLFIIFGFVFCLLGTNKVFAQSEEQLLEINGKKANKACKVTYEKDYKIKLLEGTPAPQSKFTVVLTKNVQYRFVIVSSRDFPGQGIFKLYDNGKVVLNSYQENTDTVMDVIDFNCTKTGPYHIFCEFKDGMAGNAVLGLYVVRIL